MVERIVVVGLGYVGLPLLVQLRNGYSRDAIGLDVDEVRVKSLRNGVDNNREFSPDELFSLGPDLATTDAGVLSTATMIIVCVPTPADGGEPNLKPLIAACTTIAEKIESGGNVVVCFESTVAPGTTENVCGAIIEEVSKLQNGYDFHLGYAPERMNPGDKRHTLDQIVKVVSANNVDALNRMAKVYASVSHALQVAPSIRVAEMAKLFENVQRDLNIAAVNELASVCRHTGISTHDVLEVARSKWNFVDVRPGFVGGHCISVDPHYYIKHAATKGIVRTLAERGRQINDDIVDIIAHRVLSSVKGVIAPRVLILGLTYKPGVTDTRNSGALRLAELLRMKQVVVHTHDPLLYADDLTVTEPMDAIVFAVSHEVYKSTTLDSLNQMLDRDGMVIDPWRVLPAGMIKSPNRYWSL